MDFDLEEVRKEYKKQLLFEIALSILLYSAVIVLFGVINSRQSIEIVLNIIMDFPLLIALWIVFHLIVFHNKNEVIKEELYNKYYDKYVSRELKKYFSDDVYTRVKGLERFEIAEPGVQQFGNRFTSNNLICAKYKGLEFKQSDISINMEGAETTSNLFLGQWAIIENNKDLQGNIFITQNNFLFTALPKGLHNKGYTKLELSDSDFTKKYTVFVQNPDEARDIITPNVMNKLIELYENCDYRFSITMNKGKLHIASDTKKPFININPLRRFNDEKESLKNQKRIKDLVDIIDLFV